MRAQVPLNKLPFTEYRAVAQMPSQKWNFCSSIFMVVFKDAQSAGMDHYFLENVVETNLRPVSLRFIPRKLEGGTSATLNS